MNEFNCSQRLIAEAKTLRKDLSDGTATTGIQKRRQGKPTVDNEIESRVIEFYNSEENSRQLPGKKDTKSVVQPDGTRKLVQKKLVLSNLQELYQSFKEKYPLDKIGFTKFTLLRPKHCVLAGSSGTHTTCVCTLHENVKLMLQGANYSLLLMYLKI